MATPCKFKNTDAQADQAFAAVTAQLETIEKILDKIQALFDLCDAIFKKLEKFSNWLKIPHILSAMTFAVTIHNAAMLSNALKDTLLEVLAQCLAVVNIKDDEDNPYDFHSVFNQAVEDFLKGLLGEAVYSDLVEKWKKTIRTYQAFANILYAFQSIGASILGAMEIIGQWQAKLGNALQKYGVIYEKAYGWMNPSPNFQNKFFTAINNTEEFVSGIGAVSAEILDAQQVATNLGTQKQELNDANQAWQEEFSGEHQESKDASQSSQVIESDLTASE